MMKAATEATKLNFITDQGSTLARVSMAWRLLALRVRAPCQLRFGPAGAGAGSPRCHPEATEPARPAVAPAAAGGPGGSPLLEVYPLPDGGCGGPSVGAWSALRSGFVQPGRG